MASRSAWSVFAPYGAYGESGTYNKMYRHLEQTILLILSVASLESWISFCRSIQACYGVCKIHIQNIWRKYFYSGKLVTTFNLEGSIYYITTSYKSKRFLHLISYLIVFLSVVYVSTKISVFSTFGMPSCVRE